MAAAPQLYALGSCRIHKPLEQAARHFGARYLPPDAIEYYHNPAEIAQLSGCWLQGGDWPLALAPLLSIMRPQRFAAPDSLDRQRFAQADVLVVEICSAKLCLYRGQQLQMVRLRDFLSEIAGIDEATSQSFYADPAKARAIKLPQIETDQHWLAQDILRTAAFSQLDETGLRASLRQLHAALNKPVLYVCHFVHLPDGTPLPARALIRDAMARVVPTLPRAAFVDPTPLTEAGGYDRMLVDQGHYAPAMEIALGKWLADAAAALASA